MSKECIRETEQKYLDVFEGIQKTVWEYEYSDGSIEVLEMISPYIIETEIIDLEVGNATKKKN